MTIYWNGLNRVMRIEIDRFTIHIIPENEQDAAFIEDTLRLSRDGDTIKLERIDSESIPAGFRLETDLPTLPDPLRRDAPRSIPDGQYQRPVEDLIDCVGSWDGPPYTRGGQKGGDTKVMK